MNEWFIMRIFASWTSAAAYPGLLPGGMGRGGLGGGRGGEGRMRGFMVNGGFRCVGMEREGDGDGSHPL
jgi:hypothetical protein